MSQDPYRDWDAAYVLGALSPQDRRAYEEHLKTCPDCSAEVAALTSVPDTLELLPDDRALATITATTPPNLLPGLVREMQRERRQKRFRLAVVMSGVAATAAVAGGVITGTLSRDVPPGDTVMLAQTVASKLTADARLVDEPWGTTIEISCRYDELATPSERARGYELYVTDDTGKATLLASWTAAPGTTVKPATTTKLNRNQIKALDIRGAESGRILLAVNF